MLGGTEAEDMEDTLEDVPEDMEVVTVAEEVITVVAITVGEFIAEEDIVEVMVVLDM